MSETRGITYPKSGFDRVDEAQLLDVLNVPFRIGRVVAFPFMAKYEAPARLPEQHWVSPRSPVSGGQTHGFPDPMYVTSSTCQETFENEPNNRSTDDGKRETSRVKKEGA